jgi:hypothetical protein
MKPDRLLSYPEMSEARLEPVPVLRAIKALHTLVWAFFAGAILAIPVAAWLEDFAWVGMLAATVLVEIMILAFNRMRCPLTAIAARYTEDRRPNFDIYLPLWLAAHNKQVFGVLFIAGLLFAVVRWLL